MTKIIPMTQETTDHNRSLLTYLKVMYYFGYLPVSWVSNSDPDYFKIKFRISALKTLIMLMVDLLLSLLTLAYFYLLYVLNVDSTSSILQIFSPHYFMAMNDGIATSAISQVAFGLVFLFGFWIYSYTGYKMLPMNRMLMRPFFHLRFLINFGSSILMVTGVLFHVMHISDKIVQNKQNERGWKFYLPILLTLIPIMRYMLYRFFYESMLLSILKGWSLKRPIVNLDATTLIGEWNAMKNEVQEWIQFYQDVSDTFSFYLFVTVSVIAPAIILHVYILLTLPIQKHTIEDSYKEYIAMLLTLTGFGINYMTVVNECHKAYDETNDLRSEIILARTTDVVDERNENLLKKRQEMLVSVLAEAKPLNGKGFFNVDRPMIVSIFSAAITYIIILVQFNMDEKATNCAS